MEEGRGLTSQHKKLNYSFPLVRLVTWRLTKLKIILQKTKLSIIKSWTGQKIATTRIRKKVAEDETHRKTKEEEKEDCCDEMCFFRWLVLWQDGLIGFDFNIGWNWYFGQNSPKSTGMIEMARNQPEFNLRWNKGVFCVDEVIGTKFSGCSSQNGIESITMVFSHSTIALFFFIELKAFVVLLQYLYLLY